MANRPQKNTTASKSTRSSRRQTTSKSKSNPTNQRKSGKKQSQLFQFPEIKLSGKSGNILNGHINIIVGILLIALSLFSVIFSFSFDRQNLDGFLPRVLFNLFGLGLYLLPFILLGCGLWLIFQFNRLPVLNSERLLGILSTTLNILALIHLIKGGNWNDFDAQNGGGYLGAFFAINMVTALGTASTYVLLVAWFIINLGILFDLSTYDLFSRMLRPLEPARKQFLREWNDWKRNFSARTNIEEIADSLSTAQQSEKDLPDDFRPLPEQKSSGSTKRQSQGNDQNGTPNILPEVFPSAQTNWTLPTIEAILDPADPIISSGSEHKDRAQLIEETLFSFGAPGHVVEVHSGPTVTMYGVEPDFIETRSGKMRVRVSKISSLADDLALALAAPRIRIQAPVPGHNYVGIEVPNTETNRVTLRELLESPEFQKIHSPLRFALGKDVSGNSIAADLRDMPHLLVAGTTGSGKSVCINTILCSFLLNNSPVDLRLILVDPKRVELSSYNRIPHLLAPVIVDAQKVVGALQWVLREMDNRYHKFTKFGVRNITDFNPLQPDQEYLPHLVVVIDELADLMMLAPDETERAITRLAQLARATGIHLIIATQRPSVDVVTGLIKANFPARIAFAVASSIDSRVIIDQPGAERLLGRGDMLFLPPDSPAPIRLQGAYVSDSEIQLLVDYWKFNAADGVTHSSDTMPSHIDTLPQGVPLHQAPLWEEKVIDQGDSLLPKAIQIAHDEKRASITMLQRKLRIGYTRAARLIDTMEDKGIITPAQGTSQIREYIDNVEKDSPEDSSD